MTDDCYNRIQKRIHDELESQTPSVWLAAAFAFLGIAASAILAFYVLPHQAVGLQPGTRGVLLTIGIAGLVLTVLSFIAHRSTRKRVQTTAQDICDEMDNYSYKVAPTEGGDGVT